MNVFNWRIRHKLLLVLVGLILATPFIWVGVAHAVSSDKIKQSPNEISAAVPTPSALFKFQQSNWDQVKAQAENKLARDRFIKRKKIAARRAHLRHLAAVRKQRAAIKTAQAKRYVSRPVTVYNNYSTAGNTYTPGNCTWGVKNWRPSIPNGWHDAGQWLYAAQAAGWATGSTPRIGAVGTAGNHVVLVVSVNPLMIREMNFAGLYSVRTRAATAGEFYYIY